MNIAVSIPGAPLLVQGATGGPDEHVSQVRSSCLAALAEVVCLEREVLVVGVGDDQMHESAVRIYPADAPDTLGGLGIPAVRKKRSSTGATMPQSLAVARRLLEEFKSDVPVKYLAVPMWGSTTALTRVSAEFKDRVLVVVGDGSARRGPKPPKSTHPDADAADIRLARALRMADMEALQLFPVELATSIAMTGLTPWRVLASWGLAQIGHPDTAPMELKGDLPYSAAPFGVGYHVAIWRATPKELVS